MRSLISAFITYQFLFLLVATVLFSCSSVKKEVPLQKGMHITQSVKIKPGEYFLESNELKEPIMTIEGDNIVVDFNGAILNGSSEPRQPDQFKGTGISINNGKNILIKNAVVKGYKIGLIATNIDSLQILSSNFSYNYRQRLKSTPEQEDLGDWLSHHDNENDNWLRYGAALYLKNCDHALVKDVTVTEGQNGLLLVQCNNGLFYNNNMSFNSGLGLGMYRSSQNRVMHNNFDWCIRGYSHGIYNRGQDSAGILAYEQSNENIFAYNSATHSGDGFFLWAGNTFMKSGEGGCNDNLVYANDFSHASNNGVEITFSKNKIINNKIEDCHYGIWAGYSHHTVIAGNRFKSNNHDIAFEHGNTNKIYGNKLEASDIGIQLWERPVQPSDWSFAQKLDINSRNYEIHDNVFYQVKEPLKIEDTKNAKITANEISVFQKLLKSGKTNEGLQFTRNKIYQNDLLGDAYNYRNENEMLNGKTLKDIIPEDFVKEYQVEPPSDGMSTTLPVASFRGRKYMLITEWGPYNFQYPAIWLRSVEGNKYTFALFGPQGNWKIVGGAGFTGFSRKTGAMPATVVATKKEGGNGALKIDLEFIGSEFSDQFGNTNERGLPYRFQFFLM